MSNRIDAFNEWMLEYMDRQHQTGPKDLLNTPNSRTQQRGYNHNRQDYLLACPEGDLDDKLAGSERNER